MPTASAPPVIHFGHLAEHDFDGLLKKKYPGSKFILLTDENVAGFWVEYLVTEFESLFDAEIIQLPAGEATKNFETCVSVWEALSEYGITRHDIIINLGGGVITDIGGFIASAFKRGLHFINIPTSLLAQVDASVGGKTGIDLGPYKNQVGFFSNPDLVFIDPRFLATLENDQLNSGFAEMLKHGLIADKNHWHQLLAYPMGNLGEILPLIKTSVAIKKQVVDQDFDETGPRKKLNFGHTIGHAIEGFYLHHQKPLLHGYAVAYGMIAESWLSWKTGLLTEEEFTLIQSELSKRYGALNLDKFSFDAVMTLMKNDKKNSAGKINFTLLKGIGNAVYDQDVEEELILQSLELI
jgi:3-dehydroquinate synthase